MIDPQLALIRNLDDAGCDKTTQKLFLQSCSDEVACQRAFQLCSVAEQTVWQLHTINPKSWHMKQISGNENSFALHFADRKVECLDGSHPAWRYLLDQGRIHIEGDGNRVELHFGSEEEAVGLLNNPGFNILIFGNGNTMKVGKSLTACHTPEWGARGLHLVIGTPFDPWTHTPRAADYCHMELGEHIVAVGAMLFLLEDNSSLKIGSETMISWGVDIWNTDSHCIMDMEGNPANSPVSIEIGEHVWIGKDVKIGKNVHIDSDNIIGWGSVVTRSIKGRNQLAVGVPARVVKQNIRWDGRTIKEYMKGTGRS